MAVFTITFDSATKLATISKDGAAVPDVSEVSLCQCGYDGDEGGVPYSLRVEQATRDKADKTYTRVITYAADGGEVVVDKSPAALAAEGARLFGRGK